MANTGEQYEQVINECKTVFLNKMKDYGSAWRILRTRSLTDQIYIKANRIRSIEQKGTAKVDEGIKPEFIGIVNYSVMALIQLELGSDEDFDIVISRQGSDRKNASFQAAVPVDQIAIVKSFAFKIKWMLFFLLFFNCSVILNIVLLK